MLVARIEAIAPKMPSEIRRWFLERDYAIPSLQEQDWDLALANWDYVPLLIEYSEDDVNILEKRFDAFSALMVLLESRSEDSRKKTLNQQIERVVLGNPDFAHNVCDDWLGVIEALIVKKILGEEIPQDVPEWMRDEVMRRTSS